MNADPLSKGSIIPMWRRACEAVGIRAHDVRISPDRKRVQLLATRDGRSGTCGALDACYFTQPGIERLLLGVAHKLLDAMNSQQLIVAGRPLIRAEGERERLGIGEFSYSMRVV